MFGMRELIAYLPSSRSGPAGPWRCSGPLGRGRCRRWPPTLPAVRRAAAAGFPPRGQHRRPTTRWRGTAPSGWKRPCCAPLRHNAGNGHTCLPAGAAGGHGLRFHPPAPRKAHRRLEHCLETGQLETRTLSAGEYIYLPDLLAAEEAIAARLAALARRDKLDRPPPGPGHPGPGGGPGLCLCPRAAGGHPPGRHRELPGAHRRPGTGKTTPSRRC